MIHFHVTSEVEPAGSVRFHCPRCGRRDTVAEVVARRETAKAWFLIPVFRKTTWWVVCSFCRAEFHSRLGFDDLSWRTPDDLVHWIAPRSGLVPRFLAVLGLLMAPLPILGVLLALIGWAVNRKSPGWPRRVSQVAVGIALVVHLAFLIDALR